MEAISKELQERVAFAKHYIEARYALKRRQEEDSEQHWRYFEGRMDVLELADSVREQLRGEVRRKQAQDRRQRRVKMTPEDFEPVAVIGRGAFGEVRLCRERATGEMLAVKRLRKDEMRLKSQVGHVRAQRNLLAGADNPWIVQLRYSFQDASALYLAM